MNRRVYGKDVLNAREWCALHRIDEAHFAMVSYIVERLSPEELAAQLSAAILGLNPRAVIGWEKIKPLYSFSNDKDNPPTMHHVDLEILVAIAGPIIQQQLDEEDERNVASQPHTWDDAEYGSES